MNAVNPYNVVGNIVNVCFKVIFHTITVQNKE